MVTKVNVIRRRGPVAESASISIRNRKKRKYESAELPTKGQGGDLGLSDAPLPHFKSNDGNDDADERKTAGHCSQNDNIDREKLLSLVEGSKLNEGYSSSNEEKGKIIIDLEGVPEQVLILKDVLKGTSIYKGVYYSEEKRRWVAKITIEKVRYYLGCYDDELSAARDYAKAAFKYITSRRTCQSAYDVMREARMAESHNSY